MHNFFIHVNLEFWDDRTGRDVIKQVMEVTRHSDTYTMTERFRVVDPNLIDIAGDDNGEMSIHLIFEVASEYVYYYASIDVMEDLRRVVRVKEMHQVSDINIDLKAMYEEQWVEMQKMEAEYVREWDEMNARSENNGDDDFHNWAF